MKTMNRIVWGSLLVGLLLATGCVKLWRENIEIKAYMVEAERTAPTYGNAAGDKLWVDTVGVLPPFNVRNLILRNTDVEYETSYYAELLLSPSENFRNNLYVWFSNSGIFEEVSLGERRSMSHRLSVAVLKFYGDASSEQGAAVLEIRATLLDEQGRSAKILLSKEYKQQVEVADHTAADLIRAYNAALQQILIELEQDMLETLLNTEQGTP